MKDVGLRYLKFSKYLLKLTFIFTALLFLSMFFDYLWISYLLLVLTLSCGSQSLILKLMSVITLKKYK